MASEPITPKKGIEPDHEVDQLEAAETEDPAATSAAVEQAVAEVAAASAVADVLGTEVAVDANTELEQARLRYAAAVALLEELAPTARYRKEEIQRGIDQISETRDQPTTPEEYLKQADKILELAVHMNMTVILDQLFPQYGSCPPEWVSAINETHTEQIDDIIGYQKEWRTDQRHPNYTQTFSWPDQYSRQHPWSEPRMVHGKQSVYEMVLAQYEAGKSQALTATLDRALRAMRTHRPSAKGIARIEQRRANEQTAAEQRAAAVANAEQERQHKELGERYRTSVDTYFAILEKMQPNHPMLKDAEAKNRLLAELENVSSQDITSQIAFMQRGVHDLNMNVVEIIAQNTFSAYDKRDASYYKGNHESKHLHIQDIEAGQYDKEHSYTGKYHNSSQESMDRRTTIEYVALLTKESTGRIQELYRTMATSMKEVMAMRQASPNEDWINDRSERQAATDLPYVVAEFEQLAQDYQDVFSGRAPARFADVRKELARVQKLESNQKLSAVDKLKSAHTLLEARRADFMRKAFDLIGYGKYKIDDRWRYNDAALQGATETFDRALSRGKYFDNISFSFWHGSGRNSKNVTVTITSPYDRLSEIESAATDNRWQTPDKKQQCLDTVAAVRKVMQRDVHYKPTFDTVAEAA